MFQLKTNFGITFTPLCVFGSNRKYGQMENQLHFDRKITHFSRKTNSAFILPSNKLQDSEREREREHEHTPHMVQKPDHASPQPSSGQPRLCRPIAQITRRPSFLFFLSSSSTSPPFRSEPCILFSLSPPKTDLVATAEDRSLFPDLSLFPSISQSFSL